MNQGIFLINPETISKVFEKMKKVKPKKSYDIVRYPDFFKLDTGYISIYSTKSYDSEYGSEIINATKYIVSFKNNITKELDISRFETINVSHSFEDISDKNLTFQDVLTREELDNITKIYKYEYLYICDIFRIETFKVDETIYDTVK